MSGLTNWSEYAVRTSWGISKFDRLTRIPDERREALTSCMAMEIMSAVALRMVFATDRLTPAEPDCENADHLHDYCARY